MDGPGGLAPLAIPPGVLAVLSVGQVIDRDPLTGFVVRVVILRCSIRRPAIGRVAPIDPVCLRAGPRAASAEGHPGPQPGGRDGQRTPIFSLAGIQ